MTQYVALATGAALLILALLFFALTLSSIGLLFDSGDWVDALFAIAMFLVSLAITLGVLDVIWHVEPHLARAFHR